MKLILLRHAQPESSAMTTDESPGLSLKGKKQQQSTNQFLQENGLRPACIYTSPVRRAVETANMVSKWFSCPVVVEEALGNNFQEETLIQILKDESREAICFVGHAPTLPDFSQRLVGSSALPDIGRSSALVLDVQKEGEELHCSALLYVTPDGVTTLS